MKKQNILTVDDDVDFLMQMELILNAAGYDVTKASCRKDAEQILETTKPDAVIVDLMMDENDDGFVLCYKVKKLYPEVPTILVTGVASETGIEFDAATDEERAWVKADILMSKPVRGEQLLSELAKLLKDEK